MAMKLPALIFLLLFLLPVPTASAGQANVFVYHRFGDDRYPSTNIALETFAAQLHLLKEKNYVVLPLGEVVRRFTAGRELPEHCAVLTVDDAYATFLSGAMPLLRQYGYPATLFVNTGTVGGRGYLSWDQLRSLAAEGVEMGNHTVSHPYLLNRMAAESEERWRKRVRQEIAQAQERLEKELGEAPRLFAYPFGEYSPEVMEIVRGLGFLGAAAQQSGVICVGSDLFALPRFPMGGPYATYRGFLEKLTMRALPVEVISPAGPVVGDEDPPTLVVRIEGEGVDLSRLRCFVQQQAEGEITPDPEITGRFTIRATQALSGRRNKYTLTAPGNKGGEWFWFSQLWIYPSRVGSGAGD
jgi:peptidoglycan/xylan/chitin deacetylase (PgdA/CDA1 family)